MLRFYITDFSLLIIKFLLHFVYNVLKTQFLLVNVTNAITAT